MSVSSHKNFTVKPFDKRKWQRLLLRFFSFVGGQVQRMSHRRAMILATSLGVLVYKAARRPRRMASRNLRLARIPAPDSTDADREALIRRVFINFSKSLIDFLRAPGISRDELERLVVTEGFHHVTEALERGEGVIFITAHFGNWELLGRFLAMHNVPLTVVARDVADPDLSAYVAKLRANGGLGVKSKGGSVRELLLLLKRNEAVGLLPDQNSGDIFVPFFGVPAGTVAGPAILSLHTGAALIPAFCLRSPDDSYSLVILPPIGTHATGDKDADVRRIMTNANSVFEEFIRQYPDQWLWIHNRWKSAFEEKNLEQAWTGESGRKALAEALDRWNAKAETRLLPASSRVSDFQEGIDALCPVTLPPLGLDSV